MIKVTNDSKGKSQSWKAVADTSVKSGTTGSGSVCLEGYGTSADEALGNLSAQFHALAQRYQNQWELARSSAPIDVDLLLEDPNSGVIGVIQASNERRPNLLRDIVNVYCDNPEGTEQVFDQILSVELLKRGNTQQIKATRRDTEESIDIHIRPLTIYK